MCKRDAACDFDRINWLPLTPASRAAVKLCDHHTTVVDAAEPCLDVADVRQAIGTSGTSRIVRAGCENPRGHLERGVPHYHSLTFDMGFPVS